MHWTFLFLYGWAVASNMQDIWSQGLVQHNKHSRCLLPCINWRCFKCLQQVCVLRLAQKKILLATSWILFVFAFLIATSFFASLQCPELLYFCWDCWWRSPTFYCWPCWKYWAWEHSCCKNGICSRCCTHTFMFLASMGNSSALT